MYQNKRFEESIKKTFESCLFKLENNWEFILTKWEIGLIRQCHIFLDIFLNINDNLNYKEGSFSHTSRQLRCHLSSNLRHFICKLWPFSTELHHIGSN